MHRRSFLQTPLAAAAAQTGTARKLKTRPSKSIAASPISIGFETLDRQMFQPERCYPHLAQLGVKWARCQTGWARTETSKGLYDFAWLDGVVDSLLAIGIQPWFNLGYGNRLYTPGAAHESAVGWVPLNSPEARQAWVRFVGTIAGRYRTRVKHWELWNEPNGANFWQPDKPDPAGYVELVRMTAPILRERIPGVTLIGGAFAGLSALDYFEAAFAAGLGGLVDRISYHPYRAIPELHYAADLRALRGIVDRYKPGMPLWQGENGAPSFKGGAGALRDLEWNETRQAKWLLRRVLSDLSLKVELTSYFHTVDMANYVWASGKSSLVNAKGILRGTDYTPKPSYYALQHACALFDAESKPADLLMRFERGRTPAEERLVESVAFLRRGAPVYVYWNPTDLMQDSTPCRMRMAVWSGEAGRLDRPVSVDLLTGAVSTLPPPASKGGGARSFDVAVHDYPVLITDASALD